MVSRPIKPLKALILLKKYLRGRIESVWIKFRIDSEDREQEMYKKRIYITERERGSCKLEKKDKMALG